MRMVISMHIIMVIVEIMMIYSLMMISIFLDDFASDNDFK